MSTMMKSASLLGNTGGVQWKPVRSDYYRRVDLFPVEWPFNIPTLQPGSFTLDGVLVACATNGGPIAMVKDDRKLSTVKASYELTNKLRVFSSSGELINEFLWKHEDIVAIGWIEDDNIACVLGNGQVFIYTIYGKEMNSFDFEFPSSVDNTSIAECHLSAHGATVRLAGSNAFFFLSFLNGITDKYPIPAIKGISTAMAVIPTVCPSDVATADHDLLSCPPSIVLSSTDGEVTVLTVKGSRPTGLNPGAIVRFAVSYDLKLVACINVNGVVSHFSTSYNAILSVFDTECKLPPTSLVWCGNNAIGTLWNDFPVGPTSRPLFVLSHVNNRPGMDRTLGCLMFNRTSPMILCGEADGIRIVSEKQCELIQQLPQSLLETFHPNYASINPATPLEEARSLMEPSAILMEAYLSFKSQAIQAESHMSYLQSLDSLTYAIETCLNAAALELYTPTQTLLLSAVAYGRNCCSLEEDISADKFVEVCKGLRVLHNICCKEIGMAITMQQMSSYDTSAIVMRLVRQQRHLLALNVSEYLQLSFVPIIEDWCIAKISTSGPSVTDEQLTVIVMNKYRQYCQKPRSADDVITYEKVASVAFQQKRIQLALTLLKQEPNPSVQVALLLEMKEFDLALHHAVCSSNHDVIHEAMMHCLRSLKRDDFYQLVGKHPLVVSMFTEYAKEADVGMWRDFLQFSQLAYDTALCLIQQAYLANSPSQRINMLLEAKSILAKDKNQAHMLALVSEQVELLEMQTKWDTELSSSQSKGYSKSNNVYANDAGQSDLFYDLSVSDVVERFVDTNQEIPANKIKQHFKVPDKRYATIEAQTLARNHRYKELYTRTTAKRSSILPYDVLIEICVLNNQPTEAVCYIELLTDVNEQLDWFCNLQQWEKAVTIAVKEQDIDALQLIKARCRNPELQKKITVIITQLGGK